MGNKKTKEKIYMPRVTFDMDRLRKQHKIKTQIRIFVDLDVLKQEQEMVLSPSFKVSFFFVSIYFR